MDASSRLADLLQTASISLADCAERTRIPNAWLRDLLEYPDELESNCSLAWVCALARLGKRQPAYLFSDSATQQPEISEDSFRELVVNALTKRLMSCEDLANTIGYEIKDATGEWIPLSDWNIDMLKAASEFAQVDWLCVLNGIHSSED